jgi:hypothetical protein
VSSHQDALKKRVLFGRQSLVVFGTGGTSGAGTRRTVAAWRGHLDQGEDDHQAKVKLWAGEPKELAATHATVADNELLGGYLKHQQQVHRLTPLTVLAAMTDRQPTTLRKRVRSSPSVRTRRGPNGTFRKESSTFEAKLSCLSFFWPILFSIQDSSL